MNARTNGSTPAVVVEGLSKRFRIPEEQVNTLKELALHPLRRTRFERFDALTDVSFTVEPGEFFGIVGRNGSGKSTLMKCLAGIYRADEGAIWIDGRMSTFIELGVGFNPDLAAFDNVVTNAMMLGLTPAEATARFDEVIAFAELEQFVDLKIKNYSSGMLVRLAFSVAILAEADILLIDEVLAVGDAAFQQKCFDVFERLRREGRTILFVSHDMGAVERFCDRVLLLEKGNPVSLGDPNSVASDYLELNFKDQAGAAGRRRLGTDGREPDAPVWVGEILTEREDGRWADVFSHGDTLVVTARVDFATPVTDPLFNLVLVDDQGRNVVAASNVVECQHTGDFDLGDSVAVRVSMPVLLAPGRYRASLVVQRASGLEELGRREFAATLRVTNPNPMGGLVDLPFEIDVARRERAVGP